MYKHIKTDERIKLKTDDPRIGIEYVGIKKKKKKYMIFYQIIRKRKLNM